MNKCLDVSLTQKNTILQILTLANLICIFSSGCTLDVPHKSKGKDNKYGVHTDTAYLTSLEGKTGDASPEKLELAWPDTLTDPLGITFVRIDPGTFIMGINDRHPDEMPAHEATIQQPYYLGRFEVTQAQWQQIMGFNPSTFKGDSLPVESISWNEIQRFLSRINALNNGYQYRLPTELEWEYAARAGTQTHYFFGDKNALRTVGPSHAIYLQNLSAGPSEVGTTKPNPWGLHDMLGNVEEFTQSKGWIYPYDAFDGRERIDENDWRVIRGGSYNSYPYVLYSAYRYYVKQDDFNQKWGFRLVLNREDLAKNQSPENQETLDIAAKKTSINASPLNPYDNLPTLQTDPYGIEYVLIKPGWFMMGSDEGADDELPAHKVAITDPFYMGIYEITQAQWEQVMGYNPSEFKGDNHPVENMTWEELQEFLNRVNSTESKFHYQLPTEREWEYVCRAGGPPTYTYGKEYDDEAQRAHSWFYKNSKFKSHAVGQKEPNTWGLYDMAGNVWERTSSLSYLYSVYPTEERDFLGDAPSRVVRGGGFSDGKGEHHCSNRGYYDYGPKKNDLGFRLTLHLKEQS